jgi:hypothetical protein
MATHYYVDSNRSNDSGAGTSWSTAKKTILAALNLITNANGDFQINVAPGHYGGARDNVPYAGANGALNVLRGDIDETVVDGNSATHGRGEGPVVYFGTDQNYSALEMTAANGNYWEIKNIEFSGPLFAFVLYGSGTIDYFKMSDCRMVAGRNPLLISQFSVVDTEGAITFERCSIAGVGQSGLIFVSIYLYNTSAPSNYPVVFQNCFFLFGVESSGVYVQGHVASGYYSKVKFVESSFITYGQSSDLVRGNSAGSTYNIVAFQRCLGSYKLNNSWTNLSVTNIDSNYVFCSQSVSAPSGWTALTKMPYVVGMPRLAPWSDAVNAVTSATSPTPGTDYFGNDRPTGTYREPGAEEYVAPAAPAVSGGPVRIFNPLGGGGVRRGIGV